MLDVRRNQFFDPGPQNFDDHFLAVDNARDEPVRAKRPRAVRVESLKHKFQRTFQLILNAPSQLGCRKRRNAVVKLRKLFEVDAGNDVGPDRENLRELDEARA